MPDITMCSGKNCKVKESCYRFLATPSSYQSFFVEPPIKEDKCDYYWEDSSVALALAEQEEE